MAFFASQHAPAPASYTIKPGDTLSQIALDFYGDENSYRKIAAYDHIANPDQIYAGDTLRLPDAATIAVPSSYTPQHKAYTPRHAKPSPPVTAQHAASGNVVQIASYLASHGATKAAAAGVAACIWGESGGNPESVGSGGFGLIGWTGNTIGLPAGFNGPTGNVAADMDAELAGVVGYIEANGGFGPVNAQTSPVAAAQVFSSKYERPAVLYSDIHFGGAGDPTAIFNAI